MRMTQGICLRITMTNGGVYLSIIYCFLTLCCISTLVSSGSQCETCQSIVTRFKEGLENTANSNFGGGNTNWEERKLGTYAYSETRLIEILDHSCLTDNKECHHMLEENEELLETWWFKHYTKTKVFNLLTYFCIDEIQVCCPNGTYGKECRECPGSKERICTGNGDCQGSGTREGNGKCSCHEGYQGDLCADCAPRFFQQLKNDSHTICVECHIACNTSCHGEDAASCADCKEGWKQNEAGGCTDINECELNEEPLCATNQFCLNNEGSYSCISCDRSCDGCTGPGSSNCTSCSARHFLENDSCQACHASCNSSCSDTTHTTCDECASGWTLVAEQGCQDIDECTTAEVTTNCNSDSYCVNSVGSFICRKCHQTCSGCHGPGPMDCNFCSPGYTLNEQNECVDVDECLKENELACPGVGEKCVNTLGSFICECQNEYTKVRNKCQLKNKVVKKKKKDLTQDVLPERPVKQAAENLPPKNFEGKLEENLDGFRQSLQNLGAPVKGVPIDDMVVMEGHSSEARQFDNATPQKTDRARETEQNRFVRDDL